MKLNKQGQTEEEFLKAYDPSVYPRPSVTVDTVIFCKGKVLLIKRGNHPFIDTWALPGGFVEPEETCEQAASRELMEETGVSAFPQQLKTYSDPHRDPRTRVITVAFTQVIDSLPEATAGDDASDAKWFDIIKSNDGLNLSCDGISINIGKDGKSEDIASDHGVILTDAYNKHF